MDFDFVLFFFLSVLYEPIGKNLESRSRSVRLAGSTFSSSNPRRGFGEGRSAAGGLFLRLLEPFLT
jgi:hypothetical protein